MAYNPVNVQFDFKWLTDLVANDVFLAFFFWVLFIIAFIQCVQNDVSIGRAIIILFFIGMIAVFYTGKALHLTP